ncbi:hypothetical protein HDU97_006855 [Phlyctochytrium planicorne]|nr:hypothetical protein HDU97_006855 [Phlyctochytrium planicorne]
MSVAKVEHPPQDSMANAPKTSPSKSKSRSRKRNNGKAWIQKQDPSVPPNLASMLLILAVKRLAEADDKLMSLDTLSTYVREDYFKANPDTHPDKFRVEGGDDWSEGSVSRSSSPEKSSDAFEPTEGLNTSERYRPSSPLRNNIEPDDATVPSADVAADDEAVTLIADESKTPPHSSKDASNSERVRFLDVRFFLDKIHLRRVIANSIMPITIQDDATGKTESYEVDVIEDKKRKGYPWIAKAFKFTPAGLAALKGLPLSVKLATPKSINPQMIDPSELPDNAEEYIEKLNVLLEKRRNEVRSRRKAAESRIQETRKEAIQERMRIQDQNPIPTEYLAEEFVVALARAAGALLKLLQQPAGFMESRYSFLSRIQGLIDNAYPNSGVKAHLFGSSVTGLGTSTSDVDVTLEVPGSGNPEDHPCSNMYTLGGILRRAGMQKVATIAHARVPICKFYDPVARVNCDINVGNMLGIANSRLLSTYLKLDPRLHPLIMLIKHWAKSREINNPAGGGTISSYAYALMAINFMQVRGLLPSLQKLFMSPERNLLTTRAQEKPKGSKRQHKAKYKNKESEPKTMEAKVPNGDTLKAEGETDTENALDGSYQTISSSESIVGMVTWDISFLEDLSHPSLSQYPKNMGTDLEANVVSLFYEFMRYYGWEYTYKRDRVVSIREGTVLDYLPDPLYRQKSIEFALVVEDPFQLDRNTTGMVEEIPVVLNEFRRACRILADACSGYDFGKGNNSNDIDTLWRNVFERAAPRNRKDSEDVRSRKPQRSTRSARGSTESTNARADSKEKKRSLSRSRTGKMSMPTLPTNQSTKAERAEKTIKSADNVRLGLHSTGLTVPLEFNRTAKSQGNIATSSSTSASSKQSLRHQKSDRSLERSRSTASSIRSTSPSFQQLSSIQEVGVPLSPKSARASQRSVNQVDVSTSSNFYASEAGSECFVIPSKDSSMEFSVIISRHKSTPNLKEEAAISTPPKPVEPPQAATTRQRRNSNTGDEGCAPPRTAWGNAPVPIRRLSQEASSPLNPMRRSSQDAGTGRRSSQDAGSGRRPSQDNTPPVRRLSMEGNMLQIPLMQAGGWTKTENPEPILETEVVAERAQHPAERLKDFTPQKVRKAANLQNRGGNLQ